MGKKDSYKLRPEAKPPLDLTFEFIWSGKFDFYQA